MNIRGFLSELTCFNPIVRLKLRNGTAYHWTNIILANCFILLATSETLRFLIYAYSKWLDSHLPESIHNPEFGSGITSDSGASIGYWDYVSYLAEACSLFTILAVGVFRVMVEAASAISPSGGRGLSIPDDVRVLPLKSSQILFAVHDWPYIKSGMVIFVGCALLALPSRQDVFNMGSGLLWEIRRIIPFELGEYSIYAQSFYNSPDFALAVWAMSWWFFIFGAHRTILTLRVERLGFFKSRLFLAWIVWGVIFFLIYALTPYLSNLYDVPYSDALLHLRSAAPYLVLAADFLLFACALLTPINLLDAPAKPQKLPTPFPLPW